MTQPFASRDGRVLGKSLLTLANVITAVAPLAADWNDSHIFNDRWPAHARFHGVTALADDHHIVKCQHLVRMVWLIGRRPLSAVQRDDPSGMTTYR
jgi:hypothetical protein